MIRATAMTEAKRRNQIGHPAAWMIANNAFPYRYFGCVARTVSQTVARRQVSAMQQHSPLRSSDTSRDSNL
jgi:hypothetical protein